MIEIEKSADEWGPRMIVQVYDTKTCMIGVLVIDNTALGPGKGGIRMQPDLTTEEVVGLARAMTWKNAMAGLPFGGAKSGIKWDPRKDKEKIVRKFARSLRPFTPDLYVAGPDMNMGEKDMGIIAEELGRESVTGKPANMGGLPHELGSTGFGVAESAEISSEFVDLDLNDAKIAIEGFGNVGTFTAKYLSEKGAKIVAVSDSKGTIYNKDGLDVEKLIEVKGDTRAVTNYKPGKVLKPKDLFGLPVDVLIPGARPNVINDENKDKVKAKLIVEAANIPIPVEIEKYFHKKGVLVVPDFIVNAGGVISSYVEHIGKGEKFMFKTVKEKVRENTRLVLERSKEGDEFPRDMALKIAQERVRNAMEK